MAKYFKKKRKGVSPLIAAVLLIAFTMAIAALLTAWVTQFTKAEQEKSEMYREKIDCAGSNFIANNDFNRWDSANENFTTRLENIGFNGIQIRKIQVWYDIPTLPKYLNMTAQPQASSGAIELAENQDIPIGIYIYETEDGTSDETTLGEPNKIQFHSTCDGVWFIIERPIGGWNTQQ